MEKKYHQQISTPVSLAPRSLHRGSCGAGVALAWQRSGAIDIGVKLGPSDIGPRPPYTWVRFLSSLFSFFFQFTLPSLPRLTPLSAVVNVGTSTLPSASARPSCLGTCVVVPFHPLLSPAAILAPH